MKRFLMIIILLLTLIGCQKVQTSDVVGTWVINEESREWLPLEVKESLGKIIVSDDGTFFAYELPKKGYYDSGKYVDRWRMISGRGTWKFIDISGIENLHLGFDKLTIGNTDEQDDSYGFPLNVSKWWSTVDLYYYPSGPDVGWERIDFEKYGNLTK
jgi:hypothetical protein